MIKVCVYHVLSVCHFKNTIEIVAHDSLRTWQQYYANNSLLLNITVYREQASDTVGLCLKQLL
jgi:hypothetical protein